MSASPPPRRTVTNSVRPSSARQGPWTDIYGLSATLHYAITGHAPPSAYDRLMADTYKPLAALWPQGFPIRLLRGVDAGLSLAIEHRPETISAWRALLHDELPDSAPTVVMAPAARPASHRAAARRGWLALGTGIVLAGLAELQITAQKAEMMGQLQRLGPDSPPEEYQRLNRALLDLELRRRSNGERSLDDLVRKLFERHGAAQHDDITAMVLRYQR